MSNKQSVTKTIVVACSAAVAFAAISILGPIIWERKARKENKGISEEKA